MGPCYFDGEVPYAHGFCPVARNIKNRLLLWNRVGAGNFGVIPTDLLAQERKFIFARSGDLGRVEAAASCPGPCSYCGLTAAEVRRLQKRALDTKTRQQLRTVDGAQPWHGKLFLTQFLTGHGFSSPQDGKGSIPSMHLLHILGRQCFPHFYRVLTF